MTSETPDTDTDFQFIMRRTMEIMAAPALACGQRTCRRQRRCTGSGPHMADYPCRGRLPRAVFEQIVVVNDLQCVIADHILKGEPIEPLTTADPKAVAMAVTLCLRMIPKSRWHRVRRALAKAGIPSPLPSLRKPASKRHKNATR